MTKVHIYNDPPTRAELKRLASRLDQGVKALVGTRSRAYRDLDLGSKELSDKEWLDEIERTPRLLRRPILVRGDQVVVGWNEGAYRALLEQTP